MSSSPKKYNLAERILKILGQSEHPISAKDIEGELQHEFNKTSIYRQLEKLSSDHKISKIEMGRTTLFELDKDHHAHLLCVECGALNCLPGAVDMKSLLKNIDDKKVVELALNVRGYCDNCVK
jgi:Fe2+ or Zn2+ uptake regulation protein